MNSCSPVLRQIDDSVIFLGISFHGSSSLILLEEPELCLVVFGGTIGCEGNKDAALTSLARWKEGDSVRGRDSGVGASRVVRPK